MWKKIIGSILVVIALLDFSWRIYDDYQRMNYCNQLFYVFNKYSDGGVKDYILWQENMSGFCDSHFSAFELVNDCIMIGIGWYLLKSQKSQPKNLNQ